MSKGWEGGSTRAQRKVRAAILARNQREHGGRCQVGVVCKGEALATCVHHTLGKGMTGDDPRYQVASCMACNLRVGDPMSTPDPPAMPITRW